MTCSPQSDRLACYLTEKQFQADFGWGHRRYTVTVRSPTLSGFERHVGDDGGPCYTVQIPQNAAFEVRYEDARGRVAEYRVNPAVARVRAPARDAERERFPFVLEFVDGARGLRFWVAMGHRGEVEHVDVERVHVTFDVPRLLFGDRSSTVMARQSA